MNQVPMKRNYSGHLLALRCCITALLLALTMSCGIYPTEWDAVARLSVSNGATTNKNYINTGDTATLSWSAPRLLNATNQTLISLTVAGQTQAINTAVSNQTGTLEVSPTVTTVYTLAAVFQNASGETEGKNLTVTLYVDEPTVADIIPDIALQECITEAGGNQFTYARQFNEYLIAQEAKFKDKSAKKLECNSKGIVDITGLDYFSVLDTLSLDYNVITDILPVTNIPNLRILRFGNNKVSDISAIASLTKLRSLTIENNDDITDVTVISTMKSNVPAGVNAFVYASGLALDEVNCNILKSVATTNCTNFVIEAPECGLTVPCIP